MTYRIKNFDLNDTNIHVQNAINELDAGIFSSDSFEDINSIRVLEWYAQKWLRTLVERREAIIDEEY